MSEYAYGESPYGQYGTYDYWTNYYNRRSQSPYSPGSQATYGGYYPSYYGQPQPQPEAPPKVKSQTQEQTDKRKKNRDGIIALVFLVLLLVGGGIAAAVLLIKPSGPPGTNSTTTTESPITPATHVPVSVSLTMTDIDYADAMMNPNDATFQATQTTFCDKFKELILTQSLTTDECYVQLRPGSVQAFPLQSQIPIGTMTAALVVQKVNIALNTGAAADANLVFNAAATNLNYCDKASMRNALTCRQICLTALTATTRQCACLHGYTLNADGSTCDDIDECTATLNICGTGNTCLNTVGAYRCICGSTQVNAHQMKCRDKTACDFKPCEYLCSPNGAGFTCSCPSSGFTLDANGITCSDVDECSPTSICTPTASSTCVNTKGSYTCTCATGYYLELDGKTCTLGTISVATAPTRYDLPVGVTSPRKDITCTITLTGSLANLANSEIQAKWIINGVATTAAVTGTGFDRTVALTSLSSVALTDHGQYICWAKVANAKESALTQVYVINACGSDYFQCATSRLCISRDKMCDEIADCADGSDETDTSCVCPTLFRKCANYECIASNKFCNGVNDCGDWSDEGSPACTSGPSFCDGTVNTRSCPSFATYCRTPDKFCDNVPDCPMDNDEGSNCITTVAACVAGSLVCDQTRCVSTSNVCNGIQNCIDHTDETSCPASVTDVCKKCTSTGVCVADSQWCDGVVDCVDGSDEANNCLTALPLSHYCGEETCFIKQSGGLCPAPFILITGRCAHPNVYCDGIYQLPDGSDDPAGCATNCASLSATHFLCDSSTKCLPLSKKCDGFKNCVDGSDEPATCDCSTNFMMFGCGDPASTCRSIDVWCNGVVDCPNGADEPVQCQISCPTAYIRCKDVLNPVNITAHPICIPSNQKCDGIAQCPMASDEYACACGTGRSLCANLFGCISNDAKCDGKVDCDDGSDEANCVFPLSAVNDQWNCPRGKFRCDGDCVDEYWFCNGMKQCKDGLDEPANCLQDCGLGRNFCDGRCVSNLARCDGKMDCSDGSDEEDCYVAVAADCPGFVCTVSRMCIDKAKHCDRVSDCPDNSDETNCHLITSAACVAAGMFMCDSRCLSSSLRCDGKTNCKTGLDEQSCYARAEKCGMEKATTAALRDFLLNETPNWLARGGAFNTSCVNGQCIPIDRWCDGVLDCLDGTDEASACSTTNSGCPTGAFKCAGYESCIPGAAQCDGIKDCKDGSDEQNCLVGAVTTCPLTADQQKAIYGHAVTFFTCTDGACILSEKQCDGTKDCDDGSDETTALCCQGLNKFHCMDGKKCIEMTSVCDGEGDCIDNSDETLCLTPPIQPACATGQFRCDNGNCISESDKCNEENDCNDWSDEKNCVCESGYFRCALSHVCKRVAVLCDGKIDCPDGDNTDEASCPGAGGSCAAGQFKCTNNKCVANTVKCDGVNDCGDWSDETTTLCGACAAATSFQCTSPPICRPNSMFCDRKKDCPDNSDESATCGSNCKTGQVACGGRCVDPSLLCDGIRHCPGPDYNDEANCDCAWGMFKCTDNKLCVHDYKFCDGIYDCADFSDEPVGCFAGCKPHEILCAGACRPLSVICQIPSICTDVVPTSSGLTCSTKLFPNPAVCGVPTFKPDIPSATPYIILGNDAIPHSMPWLVSVQTTQNPNFNYGFEHQCGGSIIDNNWVLTAAHCVYGEDKAKMRVVAGEHDFAVISPNEQIRTVSQIIIHPSYSDSRLSNDIALLQLSQDLVYDDYVSTICLTDTAFTAGTACIKAGWGENLGTANPAILQAAEAVILDKASCYARESSGVYVTCTGGGWERGSSNCQGDSGGPLMCARGGTFFVQGVTSYGPDGCLRPIDPDVWTDVTNYYSWIQTSTGMTIG